MKEYVGVADCFGEDTPFAEVFILENGVKRCLDPRLDICNHSPTGYSWGYMGSGPAQLALAILADHTGTKVSSILYMAFKNQYLVSLKMNEAFRLNADVVEQFCKEYDRGKR